MKSCRECVHGARRDSVFSSVHCNFPLPVFMSYIEGVSRWVNPIEARDCPTYQPREERGTQP